MPLVDFERRYDDARDEDERRKHHCQGDDQKPRNGISDDLPFGVSRPPRYSSNVSVLRGRNRRSLDVVFEIWQDSPSLARSSYCLLRLGYGMNCAMSFLYDKSSSIVQR